MKKTVSSFCVPAIRVVKISFSLFLPSQGINYAFIAHLFLWRLLFDAFHLLLQYQASSSPGKGGEFGVGLDNDGQRAPVGVEHGVQSLRFAERIASQGGG